MRDLNSIALFVKVVETGGFTAAAAVLGIPKSSVSRKVATLERELGIRLLERTTRKIKLTEAGQIYFKHSRRILEELENADRAVETVLGTPHGFLRVSVSVTTGQHLLRPVLAEFLKKYPEIQLQLVLENRLIDLLDEGYDIALRVGELPDSNMIAKLLGHSTQCLYASPAYLEKKPFPKRPADLIPHDLYLMSASEDQQHLTLTSQTDQQRIKLQPKGMINDFTTLHQLAIDGAGISILPNYMCLKNIEEGALIRILPEWSISVVAFHAIYPSHKGATPKVRAFLDFISDKFKTSLAASPGTH